jgi:hypothetical protein
MLVLLFVGAVTVHNAEEAIWLPNWSLTAGRWHVPVAEPDFRFAVAALTLLAYACAALAIAGSMIGDYLICGYALAMALNVFVPHLAATVALKRYAPGTATALLVNLPVMGLVLWQGTAEHRVDLARFAWTGPLTVVAILASIPLLFALSAWLRGHWHGGGMVRKA